MWFLIGLIVCAFVFGMPFVYVMLAMIVLFFPFAFAAKLREKRKAEKGTEPVK